MNGLVFRLVYDTGMSAIVCRITDHHCLPSSYRDESCTRCPLIRPRTDWP